MRNRHKDWLWNMSDLGPATNMSIKTDRPAFSEPRLHARFLYPYPLATDSVDSIDCFLSWLNGREARIIVATESLTTEGDDGAE